MIKIFSIITDLYAIMSRDKNKNQFCFLLGLICIGIFSSNLATAKLLQIIHTNDLHSFFEHSEDLDWGGYAAVKSQIDQLKSDARAQGIDTLVLDAGDFSEGSPFFIASQGQDSWNIMESMGYDAVVLGNHDWLMGLDLMNDLLGKLRPNVPFLSANFNINPWYANIARYVQPYTEFNLAGVRIAVLGLSTDDALYRWRIRDGSVDSPKLTTREFMPKLRRNNDFVIALTHLGVDDDKKLIRNTSGIDLVVGGHSHTELQDYLLEKDLNKKNVPIVQAGAHGKFVGDLLVDLKKDSPLQILRYRLIPVVLDSPKDETIVAQVAASRLRLENLFGTGFLYDPIAVSTVPLERPLYHKTWWGEFFAETMMESADAELAIDVGEFFGPTQPAGLFTMENLLHFYPRIFSFNLPFGWTIWTVSVPGNFLKDVIDSNSSTVSGTNQNFVTSGILKDEITGEYWIKGKKLNPGKRYKVAVSEGVGRGAQDSSRVYKHYLKPKDTGVPILYAIERKIRKMGPIIGPTPTSPN